MKVINEIRCLLDFYPDVAEKIAKETTDGDKSIKVKATLAKGEGFTYGNGTYTLIEFENYDYPYEHEVLLDTRYTKKVMEDFFDFVADFMEERYGENLASIMEL